MPSIEADTSIANAARIYDYMLGGKDNYAADREAADDILRRIPDGALACHQNREFLKRVVKHLATTGGIRQFVDFGSGLPTRENVHEVVHRYAPDARVVYVDYDKIVLSHARALLATSSNVTVVEGDLREPEKVLADPILTSLIDFRQPVAMLLFAVLHFLTDNESPITVVRYLMDQVPGDSYMALSHITADQVGDKESLEARQVYDKASAPVIPRSRTEVTRFFDGMEILEPQVVPIQSWRREYGLHEATRTLFYGGLGWKP